MLESEPNRAQRNETAVRWFLLGLLEPDDRRAASNASSRSPRSTSRCCSAIAEQLDALPHKHPFRGTVELGLRTSTVMQQWLREQAEEA